MGEELIDTGTKWFTDLKDGVMVVVNEWIEKAGLGWETMKTAASKSWEDTKTAGLQLWSDIKTGIVQFADDMLAKLTGSGGSFPQLKELAIAALEGLKKFMTDPGGFLLDILNGAISIGENLLKGLTDTLTKGLTAAGGLIDTIKDMIGQVVRAAIDAARRGWEDAKAAVGLGGDSGSGAGGGSGGGYATGTMNARGGLHMVGELGRELVYTPPGSAIFSANRTKRMLNNLANMSANSMRNMNRISDSALVSGSSYGGTGGGSMSNSNNTSNVKNINVTINTNARTSTILSDLVSVEAIAGVS
jgi:hypothetical protein